MRHHNFWRRPAFARLFGAMTLGSTLFGGQCFAAPQAIGPEQIAVAMPKSKTPSQSRDADPASIRLAGAFGVVVGVSGVGLGARGRQALYDAPYCNQPGYCYPGQTVEEVVVPRTVRRRTIAAPKIATGRRKVRAAKAVTPKRRLVRSIAGAPEAAAAPGTPYSFGGSPRESFGGAPRSATPVAVGEGTGGGRVTPSFRTVPGGGGGGGGSTLGDASGGGRVTPTFRTAPRSGRGR